MKAACSIFAFLVYATSTCAFAFLSEPTIIKVEATYKGSKKQVGYVDTWDEIKCHPSKNSKTYGLDIEYRPTPKHAAKQRATAPCCY